MAKTLGIFGQLPYSYNQTLLRKLQKIVELSKSKNIRYTSPNMFFGTSVSVSCTLLEGKKHLG